MKKVFAVILTAAIAFSSLAACSSKTNKPTENQKAASTAEAESNEKLILEVMTTSYAGGGWPDDFITIKKMNEKLNIDLKMQWVPSDNYTEKINVLAASNTFPDSFMVGPDPFNRWKDKGLFLDIKPLLGKYPNITKHLDVSGLEILNPKGKYLGLPYYNIETRDPLVIRKDWLDKLKLKMPTTLDEFYEVAKAFAKNDPDGNGKNDTIGISMSIPTNTYTFGGSDMEFVLGAFGLGNEWKEEGGKLVPVQVQAKELKDSMSFLRKAYEEGVLDKDFPVNKQRDPWSKLEAGKSGIAYVNPFQVLQTSVPALKKIDPNAELVQLIPPKGPSGQQVSKTFGTTSKMVINAKIDAKKQQRLLKLYDYMLSDEGYDLIKNGVEGVHYTKNGDKFTKTEAFDKERPYLFSTWILRRYDPLIQIRKFDDQEKAKIVSAWMDTNAKYKQVNPAAGLNSDTNVKLGKNLNQKWMETMVKVIAGQEPVSAIDKAVADWKANGGDNIIKEMNEEYQKTK